MPFCPLSWFYLSMLGKIMQNGTFCSRLNLFLGYDLRHNSNKCLCSNVFNSSFPHLHYRSKGPWIYSPMVIHNAKRKKFFSSQRGLHDLAMCAYSSRDGFSGTKFRNKTKWPLSFIGLLPNVWINCPCESWRQEKVRVIIISNRLYSWKWSHAIDF